VPLRAVKASVEIGGVASTLSRPLSDATVNLSNLGVNTLRTGLFKLFKRPFPGFLTVLTL
jgi:hypothetical protein